MNRQECLDRASEIIHTDRNVEYGEPEDNFGDIASYWTTYLGKKLKEDEQISAPDVAIMSALIKVSRLQQTPGHEDSWVDIAGYAACGAQCADQMGSEARAALDKLAEIISEVLKPELSEARPAIMACGCQLSHAHLIDCGGDLHCGKCGYHYPKPEWKYSEEELTMLDFIR